MNYFQINFSVFLELFIFRFSNWNSCTRIRGLKLFEINTKRKTAKNDKSLLQM